MIRSFWLGALVALSACGGGGSGGGVTPPPQTLDHAPVAPVLQAYATTTATYSAAAASGQTLSLSIAPGAIAQLSPNTTASATYDATVIVRQGAQVVSSSAYRVFFNPSPFKVIGVQRPGSSGTLVYTATQTAEIPATASVGASGLIFSAPSPPSSIGVGPLSATWSVNSDSPTTAWVCVNITSEDGLVTTVHGIESDCFRANAQGAISGGFMSTLTANGVATVFK